MSSVFQQARSADLLLTPVTGLYRDPAYQNAARDVVHTDGRGVCIRIEPTDIENEELDKSVAELMNTLGVKQTETDLMIDLKEIHKDQIGLLVRSVRDVIRTISNPKGWRTLTLVATAFPQTMAGFDPNTISLTSRAEWQLWTTLLHNASKSKECQLSGIIRLYTRSFWKSTQESCNLEQKLNIRLIMTGLL